MGKLLLLALCGAILFPGILYEAETHGRTLGGVLMKVVSSSTFVLLGALCAARSPLPELARFFVIGEILGAVGDVILHLGQFCKGSPVPFCLGGGAFLAGHVLFIAALGRAVPGILPLALPLTALLFAIVLTLLLNWTRTDPVMRVLTGVYMLTVTAFAAFALAAFCRAPSFGRALLALGALVFLFGDFDLMLNNMGTKKWKFIFPCLYVYYPAQILVALSLAFLR